MSTEKFWNACLFSSVLGKIRAERTIKAGENMKRKIWIGTLAAFFVTAGILIWQLDIPNWQRLDLNKLYAQPKSSVVYDAHGNAVGAFSTGSVRLWTPLSDIPDPVRKAFIAAEDQRFYEHCGISIRRILGALINNIRTRSYSQGASTITQQLIKLTHLSGVKTLSRKAQEAVLAIQLENRLSKDEILECYLNTIYFGHGAYGIGSAAHSYFNKEVSELTCAESALLAGVIKAPSTYAPHLNPEKSLTRRDHVLSEMENCGFITEQQLYTAKQEMLQLSLQENDSERYGWFMDSVLEEASAQLSMSVDDVLSAGYSIHTAFEPALQDSADSLFSDDSQFPADASDGTPVQAAMIAMRPDGQICAVVGGRKYEVQRGLNRATSIRRSPGSAIKPISTYAAAIDAYGFAPSSLVEDTPREFSGNYSPGNAGGKSYGTVTLREALSRSLNIATVDLADLIGVNAVRNYALRFGLDLDLQDNNLAFALGSMTHGISPAVLCAAYSTLANGGMKASPHFIMRIEDPDGGIIFSAEKTASRAVREATAYMITDMLKTAATTGSARALAHAGIPVAGKTGTVSDSDGSTRDIWTAAYTPDLILAVWMGFDSPGGEHRLPSSEGGSGYPARLCARMLNECRPLLSCEDFARPAAVHTALIDRLALDDDAVLLATEQTPADYIVTELFHPDNLPREFSSNWSAPDSVTDLTLLSGYGETPVLQFTIQSDTAEYLVLRTCDGYTDVAATLTGDVGETIRFADTQSDLSTPISYSILPRHRLLYERGTLLTGKESAAVTYSPGGIMNLFFGSDGSKPTTEPADIELNESQSLFG